MNTPVRPKRPKQPVEIWQLRIDLKGVKPKVWRRILVPATIRLDKLHNVLQIVMGWTDSHLHQFTIGDGQYGRPDYDDTNEIESEVGVRLKTALGGLTRFLYEYDFGDGWEHVIKVEKVLPPGIDLTVPTCLDGQNACPPEDVGGPFGYEEFLAALADANHEEHQTMKDWIGGSFDPTAFDPDRVSALIEPASARRSMR
jgi:Plasmid pRiA4b ORF-3-like protein